MPFRHSPGRSYKKKIGLRKPSHKKSQQFSLKLTSMGRVYELFIDIKLQSITVETPDEKRRC